MKVKPVEVKVTANDCLQFSLHRLYFIIHQTFEIFEKTFLPQYKAVNSSFTVLLPKNKLCSLAVWYNLTYLKPLFAEISTLNGSKSSTHSLGVAIMRSQRAASCGLESIQSTGAP